MSSFLNMTSSLNPLSKSKTKVKKQEVDLDTHQLFAKDQGPKETPGFEPRVHLDNLLDDDSSDASRKGTPNPWDIHRRREIIKKVAGFPGAARESRVLQA